MEFQAVCTSADQADAEYKDFPNEDDAKKWAAAAVGKEWGQIVIRRSDGKGGWESTPVATYKANR
jgi:hypothetical protein